MAQVKIYGIREHLDPVKTALSEAIHASVLFQHIVARADRLPNEIEITITETPRHHWGFRGVPGDEVSLPYEVRR